MAFKVPASTKLHSRRADEHDRPTIRRMPNGIFRVGLSKRVLKRAGITDDVDAIDMLIGEGKDAGLVRVQAGSMATLRPVKAGKEFYMNSASTAGLTQGDGTPSLFAEIVSVNPGLGMLTFRMPTALTLAQPAPDVAQSE